MTEQNWAPESCALPTSERPLRTGEFDDLFRDALHGVDRPDATTLRLTLDGSEATIARVADLTARESECCSFFGFRLVPGAEGLLLEVAVDESHVAVLDALARHAGAVVSS